MVSYLPDRNVFSKLALYTVQYAMWLCSITNLKYWGGSEAIITRTLQLLNDLSVGYSSVRKLVKLDAVQFMLDNHRVCCIHTYHRCLLNAVFLVNFLT